MSSRQPICFLPCSVPRRLACPSQSHFTAFPSCSFPPGHVSHLWILQLRQNFFLLQSLAIGRQPEVQFLVFFRKRLEWAPCRRELYGLSTHGFLWHLKTESKGRKEVLWGMMVWTTMVEQRPVMGFKGKMGFLLWRLLGSLQRPAWVCSHHSNWGVVGPYRSITSFPKCCFLDQPSPDYTSKGALDTVLCWE